MRKDENYMRMREFSRVDAYVPFAVRLVPPEERPNIKSKISGEAVLAEFQTLTDVEDKVLSDWLKMLNAKLDSIISMLTFQREGFGSLPFEQINISGGGLSFSSKDRYKIGDVLEIKMLIPMMPPVALYIYGEVVKVEPQANSCVTGVKFIAMDEDIRDEIVKFVFRRQREMLREKRR
ncbi:pilus assembly protein PilZ [Dissulfurispira thermophila]|uniref:Pilus assembly protein PilZ n=1 Tax=Dissulfurispira thermophila TaxID=2715679 RepID=A0A7G1H1S7_9BACT|nr:PilZ domain-containing protein [Dissulfurispira thermophila]BCB96093.1 pilus assembly protein PilZ [Dissulfurispira thermophila]